MKMDERMEMERKIAELEAKLAAASGTEESKYVGERFVAFLPGSLTRIPGTQKIGVQARCMAPDPNGEFELERDFVPFRKEKDGTRIPLPFALKKGTCVCGKLHTRATSDLHQSFFCDEHKGMRKGGGNAELLKEIEQLRLEIAKLS